MKWHKGDKYYIFTDGYTIARTGPDHDRLYLLFRTDVTPAPIVARRAAGSEDEGIAAVRELQGVAGELPQRMQRD